MLSSHSLSMLLNFFTYSLQWNWKATFRKCYSISRQEKSCEKHFTEKHMVRLVVILAFHRFALLPCSLCWIYKFSSKAEKECFHRCIAGWYWATNCLATIAKYVICSWIFCVELNRTYLFNNTQKNRIKSIKWKKHSDCEHNKESDGIPFVSSWFHHNHRHAWRLFFKIKSSA